MAQPLIQPGHTELKAKVLTCEVVWFMGGGREISWYETHFPSLQPFTLSDTSTKRVLFCWVGIYMERMDECINKHLRNSACEEAQSSYVHHSVQFTQKPTSCRLQRASYEKKNFLSCPFFFPLWLCARIGLSFSDSQVPAPSSAAANHLQAFR